MGEEGHVGIRTAVGRVVVVSLAARSAAGDHHGNPTQQDHQQLRADAKQTSPNGADAATDNWVEEGASNTKQGTDALESPDEVVAHALSEQVRGGHSAQPQDGEVERGQRKAHQSDLLPDEDAPAITNGGVGGEQEATHAVNVGERPGGEGDGGEGGPGALLGSILQIMVYVF